MPERPTRRLGLFLAIAGAAMLGAASLASAAPVLNAEVRGFVVNWSVKGIVIIGGYGEDAQVTVSLNGLEADKSYRVVGSSRPCRQGHTGAATIFGFIVDWTEPFAQVKRAGIADRLDDLKSFRIFEIGNPNIQIVCTKAEHLVPGLPG